MNFDLGNRQQLNIIIVSVVLLLVIALFFIFIYVPKQAEVRHLRDELSVVVKSLNDIEKIAGYKTNLGKGILRLRSEESKLESKFIRPENVGSLLEMLSEQARQLDIDVASMQPAELRAVQTKGAKALENLECNKISVDMVASGSYKSLVDYMQILSRRSSPQFIIRKFDVERRGQGARLEFHLVVDCFTLLPKK